MKLFCTFFMTSLMLFQYGVGYTQTLDRPVVIRDSNSLILDETKLTETFFNSKRCDCEEPVEVEYYLPKIDIAITVHLVVGSGGCINTSNNSIDTDTCVILDQHREETNSGPSTVLINLDENGNTLTALSLMRDCNKEGERKLYVFTGEEANVTTLYELAFNIDGIAPTAPIEDKEPNPGEEMVDVYFEQGSTSGEVKYQILCEKADGNPAFENPPEAAYEVCLAAEDNEDTLDAGTSVDASSSTDSSISDAGVSDTQSADTQTTVDTSTSDTATSISGSISDLDPRYVCSDEVSSAGNITVTGLENEVSYRFYVVAIDKHENPSDPVYLGEATPLLAEDLWERYKREGGQAEGGYCNIDSNNTLNACFLGSTLLLLVALVWRKSNQKRGEGK